MAKKQIFNLILALLVQIWAPTIFHGFCLNQMLDITSYHCIEFQGKLMNQTLENGKKTLIFGPDFGPFWPKFGPKIFFDVMLCWKLSLNAISRKTNEQNLRKFQKTQCQHGYWPLKTKFGPQNDFLWILPLLDVRHCCKP